VTAAVELPAPSGVDVLTVVVHGLPAPQGSKRHLGGGVLIESSVNVGPWREAVKYAAVRAVREQRDSSRFPRSGGLIARMTFTFVRPKGHWRTGANAHLLRDGAPDRPAGYPDLSKLLRSTEDALTDANVWHDDGQVVGYEQAGKFYAGDTSCPDVLAAGSGAVIRIWPLESGSATDGAASLVAPVIACRRELL
jgi:Holliday junction resolvase RusA-like endonuclease